MPDKFTLFLSTTGYPAIVNALIGAESVWGRSTHPLNDGELLARVVAHDKSDVQFLHGPAPREAAKGHRILDMKLTILPIVLHQFAEIAM
jgi:hypothetical protein